MEKKTGAVVVAAGYGSLRYRRGTPHSKLLEYVQGVPMIARVLQSIVAAELEPITVVLNPLFAARIKDCLEFHGFTGIHYIIQPERRGAADAVHRALPFLRNAKIEKALITFGDMPLWQPRTINQLVELCKKHEPTMAMVSVRRNETSPVIFGQYGRIQKSDYGIRRVVEPAVANEEELASPLVNPCFWIWDLAWLETHIRHIPPRHKADGMPAEYDLPPLVEMAAKEGRLIVDLELENQREAVGVNTEAELSFIQTI